MGQHDLDTSVEPHFLSDLYGFHHQVLLRHYEAIQQIEESLQRQAGNSGDDQVRSREIGRAHTQPEPQDEIY
jgi:hypothetical protein